MRNDLFPILKAIHWSLLLKADWGKYVVGIPVVLFIIMLITGIILWWLKNKKMRKGRFYFDWKNVKTWKRKNYDLHHILRFYASFIALLISLSGIYFAYPWVKNAFNFTLSGSAELPKEKNFNLPIHCCPKTIKFMISQPGKPKPYTPDLQASESRSTGKTRREKN